MISLLEPVDSGFAVFDRCPVPYKALAYLYARSDLNRSLRDIGHRLVNYVMVLTEHSVSLCSVIW